MNPKKPRKLCKCGCGKECKLHLSKFYSQEHHNLYKQNEFITKWKSGEVLGFNISNGTTSHHIKSWLIRIRGEKCEQCSWSVINPFSGRIPLELEHKDGNWENCTEENLELLCPNCHSLTATYKALNKGNGRLVRRIRYSREQKLLK